MKLLTLFICLISFNLFSQNQVPRVQLKDLNGNNFFTDSLGFDGPIVFSFWATWCAPCKRELNTIYETYEEWQSETGVTLVAVSIDDQKTINSVPDHQLKLQLM